MRALVVDDDMATVDMIVHSVDWGKLNIMKVDTAYGIRTAKELLQENEVDIVICDIEMPGGNGLDLLKWFREQKLEGEFLLLTSHEKFDYAINAVKMKATEYLLKPFDVEELEETLQKCVASILIRKKYKKNQKWLRQSVDNVRRVFLEQLLREEFSVELFENNSENARDQLDLRQGQEYRLLISRITETQSAVEKFGKSVLQFMLVNIQSETLSGKPEMERTLCLEERGELVAVIFYEDIRNDTLMEICMQLKKNCEEYLDVVVTLCISQTCKVEQFHKTYQKALDALFSDISIYGKVFSEEAIKEQEKAEVSLQDKEKLKGFLEARQKNGFLNQLKREISLVNMEGKLSGQVLANFKQEILQMVYSYLTERGISAALLFGNPIANEMEKKALRSTLDMIRWVNYLLDRTLTYEEEVRNAQSVIGKIHAYIHQHYAEHIGRNEIAAEFFLAPEYLAKMYKKKTGMNLKDYINEYRIQQAKKLLVEGRLVSDVAAEVGFDNFSYFSTLFRKYTGVSPNIYRKTQETSF